MWTMLAIGALVSIGFGLAAIVLNIWTDFRPLTDKERSRDADQVIDKRTIKRTVCCICSRPVVAYWFRVDRSCPNFAQ